MGIVLRESLVFLYDGWNLVAEYSTASGQPGTATLVRSYEWGLALDGIGGTGGLLLIRSPPESAGECHPLKPFITLAALLLTLAALAPDNQARDAGVQAGAGQPGSPKPAIPVVSEGFVSGEWLGTWRRIGRSTVGGRMICKVTGIGPGKWKATFAGPMGREAIDEIEMTGRREGSAWIIEGEAELIHRGGRHHWTARVIRGEFSGQYTGSYKGHFEMSRNQAAK